MSHLLGIDIGGTFTDIVSFDEESGELRHAKRPSVPDDLVRGVRQALLDESIPVSGVSVIKHGTTVVINAILERSGARTALVTTRGFRDVLEIGRTNWPEPYNLFYDRDRPLVPRERRFEADERMGASGETVEALDRSALSAVADRLRAAHVESVGVCLLHSYKNPAHELEVARSLRDRLPDVHVSVSHELSREFREYERTSTVVMNAYVGPVVDEYLARLQEALATDGFTGSLYLMESSGGVTSAADARQRPVVLVESGPAAGAIGVAEYAIARGLSKAIAFDMGGTTAKACLVEDGEPLVTSEYYVPSYERGFPMHVAAVDIVEVGTGGGSIASFDEVGALSVGPLSAGAVPGPVCYGNGGTQVTVTDANLALGRLDPLAFLGGQIELDVEGSAAVLAELAQRAGLTSEEMASAVIRLADVNMASGIRRVNLERGRDPREFTLFAYGGAGPLHAASLARQLALPTVVIPPMPGNFSAFGMLLADLRHDFGVTLMAPLVPESMDALDEAFADVEQQAGTWRASVASVGDETDGSRTVRFVDCRYAGQEFTIVIPADVDVGEAPVEILRLRFEAEYEHRYGHSFPDLQVEIVNARAVTYLLLPHPSLGAPPATGDAQARERSVHFDGLGFVDTPVYERGSLRSGTRFTGPAVVEEYGATTLVHPGDKCRVDDSGMLIIDIEQGTESA